MRIYLTGFMGSGKSTVGPHVANRLGLEFADLDAIIEEQGGHSIPDIFDSGGEELFRAMETKALRATADWDDVVVALGGGALVEADNLAFAKEHGAVVYLRVPVGELTRRLCSEADTRPLLQDEAGMPLEPAAIRAKIEQMLARRRRFYEQAHVTVDAGRSVEEVVANVTRRLEDWKSG